MTLPVIIAYANAVRDEDKEAILFWQRVIVDHKQIDDDLATATALLVKENALEATLNAAREHIQSAKDALDIFTDGAENGKWKTALIRLADFVVSRVS